MVIPKLFNNILLPVTINRHTAGAVENAIELANRLECNLHILYTTRPPFFPSLFKTNRRKKLAAIQEKLNARIKPGLLLQAIYTEGNAYDEIRSYILSHQIDMVCVHDAFEPVWPLSLGKQTEKIAAETNCAVISNHRIEGFDLCDKIVLPVGDMVPINGLRVAVYLAQQFQASIHLVTVSHGTEDSLLSLKRSYHLIKENTDLPIVCNTFEGNNFHQSVISYARNVQAGLIVANLAYRKNPGFFNRLFSREYVFPGKVPVVMVD